MLLSPCISVVEVAEGHGKVRKAFPEKLKFELTSDPERVRWDMDRRLVEGTEESQEKGTTCAKALSHFLCLTTNDSHTKVLSLSFCIRLFKLLWGTYVHVNDDNHHVNKNPQISVLFLNR